MAYNKYYFWWRDAAGEFFKLADWEKITSPGQQGFTVAGGIWNTKGLAIIPFWELLIIIFLAYVKKLDVNLASLAGVWTGGAVVASGLGVSTTLTTNGIGLIIAVAIVGAWVLANLKKPIAKTGFWLLIIISSISIYHHLLFHEAYWRDNRPAIQTEMAILANEQPAQITTILGPSYLYWAWQKQIPPQLWWNQIGKNEMVIGQTTFGQFDLSKLPAMTGRVYVGLPGEFVGSKGKDGRNDFKEQELPGKYELLASFMFRDSVSFGNGDAVWKVKLKN